MANYTADDIEIKAQEHWSYVESVIRQEWKAFETVGLNASHLEAHLSIIGHHYKTAFVHGFKHGLDVRG